MPESDRAFFLQTALKKYFEDVGQNEFMCKKGRFAGFAFLVTYEKVAEKLTLLCIAKPLWATCGWTHKAVHELFDEAFRLKAGIERERLRARSKGGSASDVPAPNQKPPPQHER
jgi:hypothetical protein